MEDLVKDGKTEGKTAKGDRRADIETSFRHLSVVTSWCYCVSVTLRACGMKDASLFFGQWARLLLLHGIYNKIVKVKGHDRADD